MANLAIETYCNILICTNYKVLLYFDISEGALWKDALWSASYKVTSQCEDAIAWLQSLSRLPAGSCVLTGSCILASGGVVMLVCVLSFPLSSDLCHQIPLSGTQFCWHGIKKMFPWMHVMQIYAHLLGSGCFPFPRTTCRRAWVDLIFCAGIPDIHELEKVTLEGSALKAWQSTWHGWRPSIAVRGEKRKKSIWSILLRYIKI